MKIEIHSQYPFTFILYIITYFYIHRLGRHREVLVSSFSFCNFLVDNQYIRYLLCMHATPKESLTPSVPLFFFSLINYIWTPLHWWWHKEANCFIEMQHLGLMCSRIIFWSCFQILKVKDIYLAWYILFLFSKHKILLFSILFNCCLK